MKKVFLLLTIALVSTCLMGCAGNPNKMKASYCSVAYYDNYTCEEITRELSQVSNRCDSLYRQLKTDHSNDQWQMTAGMLIFWPTLLLLEGGDGPEADEYCRLKGEKETLTNLAREKGCL